VVCGNPVARQTLLEALEHALLPDLKAMFEAASPGRSVAVAFLNTSLNSFLPPQDALRYTPSASTSTMHNTERWETLLAFSLLCSPSRCLFVNFCAFVCLLGCFLVHTLHVLVS
jgi:hypothetical protein